MKKIKIAQIGTNKFSHGNEIFQTLKKLPDVFEIAGYALPENEKEKFPERLSVFEGYPELTLSQILNDPEIEAVAVETEEINLTKYAVMAAQNKKHIHMEKPGGTQLSEFEKLIDTVKANNIVFQPGYMYRYNPVIAEVIKAAHDGRLGRIISVEAQMNCYHQPALREWLKTFDGGMMFFLGCHLIDLVLQLCGMPKNITCLNRSTKIGEIESTDFAMAALEYENGVSFVKTSDTEHGGFMRRQLVISGEKATVEINPLEAYHGTDIYTEYRINNTDDWLEHGELKRTGDFDRYVAMMNHFAEMIRGESEKLCSYEYEISLYKTILECCKGE